jgi:hypothetical protein
VALDVLSLTAISRLVPVWASLSKENLKPQLRGLSLSCLHTNNIRAKGDEVKFYLIYLVCRKSLAIKYLRGPGGPKSLMLSILRRPSPHQSGVSWEFSLS